MIPAPRTLDDLLRENNFAANKTVAGHKDDSEKAPLSLISHIAIEQEARVMDFGRKKYDAWNWSRGIKFSRVLSALLRHAFAYAGGEMYDKETGISHMAHVRCCAAFLLDYEVNHPELNDLRKKEETIFIGNKEGHEITALGYATNKQNSYYGSGAQTFNRQDNDSTGYKT